MLESRSIYSNYRETGSVNSSGWVVELKDNWGCNRGCVGFKTKKEATKWLAESEYRIRNVFDIQGEASIYKI